jgi:AcrR family transcriptional regulator
VERENINSYAPNPEKRPAKPRKLKRAEKMEVNRRAILRAAAEVIGKHGYDGASIGRIAESAGLAQGTFYLYFESRQALFDVLLPELGLDGTQWVTERVHGARSFFELEEKGFVAFWEWMVANPNLFRVMNEAEIAAPVAFRKHFEQLVERYSAALTRGVKLGELRPLSTQQITAIAYMLIGARNNLFMHYLYSGKLRKKPPKSIIEMYISFVRGALST